MLSLFYQNSCGDDSDVMIMFCFGIMLRASHLFYVQKVFGFKVDSSTLDWTIFIKGPAVTDIGFHCKCYWLRLSKDK